MAGTLHLRADIDFSVLIDEAGSDSSPVRGSVRADGSDVVVRFSTAPSLAGSSTRPLVRPLAERLASAGLTVYLVDPSGPLLRLGAGVRAPWWQRVGTGSRRIQLHSVTAFRRSVGGPRLFEAALPTAFGLPQLGARRTETEGPRGAVLGVWRRVTGRRR